MDFPDMPMSGAMAVNLSVPDDPKIEPLDKKIALFTIDGVGLPIAYKLEVEGNEVYVGMAKSWESTGDKETKESPEKARRRLSMYDNMLKNKMDADQLLKMLKKENPDDWFVICDFNFLYPYADQLRKLGFKGFLPHKKDYELEEDRAAAKKLVAELYPDLSVADSWEFKNVDEALALIDEMDDALFVAKAFSGDVAVVVPKSNDPEINHEEIKDSLARNKTLYESKGFLLEEKIPDLIEFCPEAVAFDGELLGVSVDIELKDIGAGDSGEQTGCAADMIFWQDLDGFVYEKFLKPLASKMLRKGELTVWDANVAYSPSKDEFFFLEFCFNRWGYDSIFTELSTFPNLTEYFRKVINKIPLYTSSTNKFGASVRFFNMVQDPGFPEERLADSFIFLRDGHDHHNVWIWDIKGQKEDGKDEVKFYTAGYDKNLAVLTGSGKDIYSAVNIAYDHWGLMFSWTRAEFRPRFDYLSYDYPTAILRRFDHGVFSGWFD